MPSGYTADVADGTVTELEPFALRLARGMGALIMMRDEPWDAPIPERFEPSDYHAKALAEARTERDRIRAMSDDEAAAAAQADVDAYDAAYEEAKARHAATRERYLSMIAKVEAWQGAPEGIKEFGLQQLRDGLDFDASEPFKYWSTRPSESGPEWRAKKLEEAERNVEYHAAEYAKDKVRTESRNAWLAQLRKSLAPSLNAGKPTAPKLDGEG